MRAARYGLVAALVVSSLSLPAHATHVPHPPLPAVPIECHTQVHFSPHGGAAKFVADELGHARDRIQVAMYDLTNSLLVDALVAAHQHGVSVEIKADRRQNGHEPEQAALDRLHRAGISVEVSERSRLLHDKFAIIDGQRVITGSFNWTNSAENRNRENVLLLDCPALARLYEEEWADIARDSP